MCSGRTIGGWGAKYTTVKTVDEFASAVSGTQEGVIIVDGALTGDARVVEIGSSKSIVGNPGSCRLSSLPPDEKVGTLLILSTALSGIALSLKSSGNVIIRNLRISNAPGTAAISLESARSVWVDHCEISGTQDHLLSITRGTDYVTVTHNKFYSHHPAAAASTAAAVNVGHSDANVEQDRGKFHVTFARNYFSDVTSAVSFRFGTGHLFNSFYEKLENGIDTRAGAQIFVEGSVFEGIGPGKGVYSSTEDGFATIKDSVFVGPYASRMPDQANLTSESVGYPYDWYFWGETSKVKEGVKRWAGQTLEFMVWEEGTAAEPWRA